MRRRHNRGYLLRAAMHQDGQWWISRNGDDYRFIRSLGEGEFLTQDWRRIISGIPGPYLNLNQIGFGSVGVPMLSVDDTAGVFDVTGWTHQAGTTASQGFGMRTVNGSISSGTLTRFTASAGAGSFSQNDRGRRIEIPGAGSGGAPLVVITNGVAPDGSWVTWSSPNGLVVSNVDAVLHASTRWSNTVGNSVTWTSPPGTTSLGVRVTRNTSSGLFRVSINGSNTAANLLPTAQEKVTSGEYPNTILTSNGGILNPTDRVLDCYSPSTIWDDPIAIADGLSSAAHTVLLTVTGTTRIGGISNRAYVTGFSWSTGFETPATNGASILGTRTWLNAVSALECAHRFAPNFGADGTTPNPNILSRPPTFYGRVHGFEDQISISFNIDDVPVVISDGATISVNSKAIITQISKLYHPDNAGVVCRDTTTIYTLDSIGMTIEQEHIWRVPATMWGGYPAMLPLSGAFDRYTNSGLFSPVTSNSADGSRKGERNAWIAVSWMSNGNYATSIELSQGLTTMNSGGNNPSLDSWWLEDRAPSSGIKINKHYVPWVAETLSPVSISINDVWRFNARYRYAKFPGGAESRLSRI